MRPAGELHLALRQAMWRSGRPLTTQQVAQLACAGLVATRHTLDNMVRARKALKLEPRRVPGVKRPVPVYALPLTVQLPLPLEVRP
jgi:hypothetical protein